VIKTWGYEKILVTVTLAVLADGSKLPTCVIPNHKTMAKEQLPRGITVRRQLTRLGAQLNYEGLIVSDAEQTARDTPDETWDAGTGCI
jgi:hypothetical protein